MIKIKELFVKLTSKRYPNGKESQVIELLPEFNFQKDDIGNYYILINKNDGTSSNTMFTCHLDTVDRSKYIGQNWDNKRWDTLTSKWVVIDPSKEIDKKVDDGSITHVFDEDFIKTDGNSNLGADDKAGMVIMLNMIDNNIPGLYYFFIGEESGCIGSSNMSRKYHDYITSNLLPNVNKCISFDRRGYSSVITHQMSSRCCSDEFGNELSKQLNEFGFWYTNDSTGVYTDSAEFLDIIPECTNLSVGYFDEHTLTEKQDIEFLELLSLAILKIDWENLPIVRSIDNCKYTGKKSKTTYGNYGQYGRYGHYWDEDDDMYDTTYNNRQKYIKPENTSPVINNDTTDLKKDIDDFDFENWYNEQKIKNDITND